MHHLPAAPPLVQDPVTDGVVELGRDDRADEVRELILVGRVVDATVVLEMTPPFAATFRWLPTSACWRPFAATWVRSSWRRPF